MRKKHRKLLNEDWGIVEHKIAQGLRAMDTPIDLPRTKAVEQRHRFRAAVCAMHFDEKHTAEDIARALNRDVNEIKILIGKMRA